ncbi:MAG: flagellar motor switch protein FliM [Oscillospiraceae bacterium]|nr:flagellar motor switch protein FliM [Oscillospiraceae bacterium]
MADVLSQKQIDELLNSFSANGSKVFEEISENTDKKAKVYDFKMPKKFTKEKLKIIDSIYENYSRLLSSYLTGLMRVYCKVDVLQIEEQKYYEYNNALPDYVLMAIVNLDIDDEDIMDTSMIFQMSNPISFTMMDRLMGGYGTYSDVSRDFTEIEIGLMKGIISKMVELQGEAWSSHLEINPKMSRLETNARVFQSIGPDDIIILIMLEVEIKNIKNTISVCIPALNLEAMMGKFADRYAMRKRFDPAKEEERREEILRGIKETPLKIDAILAETQVDLYDILTLQVNDIIPLNVSIDKNVNVKIGDNIWFDGKLGTYNNKKAIKIDNIYKN